MAITTTTVNVLEQCNISPPTGSVLPTSLPLTMYDLIWLPRPTVQRLIFFELHHSKTYFLDTILPNIKHSLSLALQHFFPLVGNLAWPQGSSVPEIQYVNGDFLLLTVAESGYNDFDNLVGNHVKVASDLRPFVPKLLDKSSEKLLSLMSVQLTLFPNQGICIGINFNHVVADGRAIHHFIKSWASICKLQGSDRELILPFHDRSILNKKPIDTDSLKGLERKNITRDTFYLQRPNVHSGSMHEEVFATFIMRPHAINKLRLYIKSHNTHNEKLRLSPFVLTLAYLWICLIKARWGEEVVEEDKEETETLGFAVDTRSLVDPSLPASFFGNCIKIIFLTAKTSELKGEEGLLIAVKLIGNEIQKARNGDSVAEEKEKKIENGEETDKLKSSGYVFKPDRILSVAGSPKFGIYETDFGWGKPKKSEVLSIAGTGAISFMEWPTEVGGMEIGLVRKMGEMKSFSSLFTKTIEDLAIFGKIEF